MKDQLERLLFVWTGKKDSTVEKMVDFAYQAGKEDFWGAAPWAFKEKSDTLTTTANSETLDLPDDFEGILSLREHTTSDGRKLIRLSPDEYDRLIPYSADLATDTPAYYKVYYDNSVGMWRIAMYPTPSAAISIYINYHIIENDGIIPEKYVGGLFASMGKYIYMPGSSERAACIGEFNSELIRLQMIDSPDVEDIGRFLDEEQGKAPRHKKWYEDWN